ncbi:GT2 family glycosyltransferase [Pontibacter virosus]|uniref:GT2 family glycosyltransferase n=2 Tax=Pontibacter virosus TaxID=1765052 RepID=A0A2U1AQR5_9BACT|nr:GT2 family glycosyltransferase [Pontibacter virosus]
MDEAQKSRLTLQVLLPEPGEDTSFAAGLNKCVNYAVQLYPSIDYLLFYETDNQILEPKPLLDALKQLESRAELAACGFTVRLHNGLPAGVGQPFPSLTNFIIGKNLVDKFQLERIPYMWDDTLEGSSFSEVDVVYTSPLLVKLDAWKESGGLDVHMFPFADCDVDWARRLYKLGWRMGVIKSNSVIHDNLNFLSAWSMTRAVQNHRGRLRYFKRHRPVGIILVWPVLLILRHFLEFTFVKISVRDQLIRNRLLGQFSCLLKSSIRGYE